MYYHIPHGLLHQSTVEALRDAATDQQRGAIRRAAEWLWCQRRVMALSEGRYCIESGHGGHYYSDGVRCDCKCDHRRYSCWPMEAARLLKRMQQLQEARDRAREEMTAV
jgi:hypothetical protein